VTPHEIRHVLASKEKKKWPAPEGTSIVAACTNKRQICVALDSDELVYFELDAVDGSLNEYQDRKALPAGVTCMSMGEVPQGRQRSLFLVRFSRRIFARASPLADRASRTLPAGCRLRQPDGPHHLA
jgi:hypothetical protein